MIESIVLEKGREEVAILKLLAFFDLFDFPLSLFEINSYLQKIASGNFLSFSELLEKLDKLVVAQKIEMLDGFYFLSGRSEIISTRRKRYNYSKRKFKIAKRFTGIFALSPFVKGLAIANSIGAYNLRDGSDIDFFIISAKRRVFLARLFCTGLAKILNSRPNAKTKRDKICLSFYLAEDNLSLNKLKLPGGDPYFDFWEANLVFLLNKDGVKTNFENQIIPDLSEKNGVFSKIFNYLESLASIFELAIMPKVLRLAAAPKNAEPLGNFGVIIGRDILKMYLSDKRLAIRQGYETKLGKIL